MEFYVDGGFKDNVKYIAVYGSNGVRLVKNMGKGGTSNSAEKLALLTCLSYLESIGCKDIETTVHTDMLSLPDLLSRANLKSRNITRNPELVRLKKLMGMLNVRVDWVSSKNNKADKLIKDLYKEEALECC